MKKLLAILVLGLLWCGNSFAGEQQELIDQYLSDRKLAPIEGVWSITDPNGTAVILYRKMNEGEIGILLTEFVHHGTLSRLSTQPVIVGQGNIHKTLPGCEVQAGFAQLLHFTTHMSITIQRQETQYFIEVREKISVCLNRIANAALSSCFDGWCASAQRSAELRRILFSATEAWSSNTLSSTFTEWSVYAVRSQKVSSLPAKTSRAEYSAPRPDLSPTPVMTSASPFISRL